jgi:hypothetical protein
MAMFNNMKFNFYSSVGGIDFSTTATYEYGNWYHFCVVFTHNSDLKVFINGDKETNSQSVAAGTSTAGIQIGVIGSYSSATNTEFDGKIDQVRIFNTALTDSQVTQLYNEKPETDTSNFKAVLYEGNGAHNYISNVGMDLETHGGLVWVKSRDTAYHHRLVDSVRGLSTDGVLFSNRNVAAEDLPSATDNFTSFDKNGFTLGSTSSTNGSNFNNDSYVCWIWKGGGDAVLNEVGDINSQVSNSDKGFSISLYTNNGSASSRVGHGLTVDGVATAPEVCIIKKVSVSASWHFMTTVIDGSFDDLILNDTAAKSDSSLTAPTTTTFAAESGATGQSMVCYSFVSVAGYSKIGTYTGDGTTSGRIIYTTDDGTSSGSNGFEPSFLLTKPVGPSGGYWYLLDNKRSTTNPRNDALFPNDNLAEIESTNYNVDFLSNGFELKNNTIGYNTNNENYIYMAFK